MKRKLNLYSVLTKNELVATEENAVGPYLPPQFRSRVCPDPYLPPWLLRYPAPLSLPYVLRRLRFPRRVTFP